MTTHPPGLTYEILRAVAPSLGCSPAEISAELIEGGRSNLTYRLFAGEQQWILRRPPLGHLLATAHDMAREHRVMSALYTAGVPVPQPVLVAQPTAEQPTTVYVMQFVDGLTLRTPTDARLLTRHEAARAADNMIDELVRLHEIDYRTVGLTDFGRPVGYMDRQVRRWRQQWLSSVGATDTAPVEKVADELAARVPATAAESVVHGDYRLDNTILDRTDPGRVAAIIDWEMSTLGDPLSDVGVLIAYWSPLGARVASSVPPPAINPGFPDAAHLVARYEKVSSLAVAHLDFYVAFAHFKLAVIAQTITARYRQGMTVGANFDAAVDLVEELIDTAGYILGGRERAV